jgi:hypothetical protein
VFSEKRCSKKGKTFSAAPERPFVSEDTLPTAARLFITSPYADRVCVTSIKFEIATSNAAGSCAASKTGPFLVKFFPFACSEPVFGNVIDIYDLGRY